VTVRLHIEVEGSGPAVVLAHGFGGSARNFGPQTRVLRSRFRVVRYDARGHARSEAPDDPAAYSPELAVADMGQALDAASAAEAVVVGLSMGAVTALRFALTHPERVRGLVLAAFPPDVRDGRGFGAVAEAFAAAIERDGLEAAGAAFVWGPAAGLDAAAARLVRQGFLEHPPHGLAHTLRGVLAVQPPLEELAAQLTGLAIPTLVIVGADDRACLDPSHFLARTLSKADLVVLADAGHVVNLAQPAAFNGALLDFLARVAC